MHRSCVNRTLTAAERQPSVDDIVARVDAGDLTTWLTQIDGVLRDGDEADVPCGECTACCTSSQFVHIEPDELDTLAHVPKALRFPAPGRPPGHVVLGYD